MDQHSLKALKGGIREYINILIAIYNLYDETSNISYLNDLYKKLDYIDNIEELNISNCRQNSSKHS